MTAAATGRRRAFVTGAAYGIGAASAVALARDGHDVVVAELDHATLGKTVTAIEAAGGRAFAIALDLREQSAIERGWQEVVGHLGGVDVLVNNAAIPMSRAAIEITRAEWQAVMEVNLTGPFFLAQQAGRHWIGRGEPGTIINLGSSHGLLGVAGAVGYGTSKAAIMHMTRILAIEWVSHRIRVNAIAPGATVTQRSQDLTVDSEATRRARARIPMGRFGDPAEMAEAVRYLASDAAAYITGQVLVLDGGLTVI